jgi:hypothetical protein
MSLPFCPTSSPSFSRTESPDQRSRSARKPVVSENSNLASSGHLVLMDQSAQPIAPTNPS